MTAYELLRYQMNPEEERIWSQFCDAIKQKFKLLNLPQKAYEILDSRLLAKEPFYGSKGYSFEKGYFNISERDRGMYTPVFITRSREEAEIKTLKNLAHDIGYQCVLKEKSTLLKQIPGCVDLDDELWPQLTKEEADFISQTPWTKEIGDTIDRLVYEKIHVKPGHPLFTTIIVECDAVVYLDISDALLAEHCKKRHVDFNDAKNVKEAIEKDWNHHKTQGGKFFYYLTMTE